MNAQSRVIGHPLAKAAPLLLATPQRPRET